MHNKMALRLRRDVQKASYYVWFLGAEEAKGLRGQRVINSVLPYLINRSRSQDSIKVTLQVSHKGIKIIQGSSKHFIPHSAITSSMQSDDIVACVLLLYNPATKCPLHVHAYRCDSETTAEALQQQLQILINRPENQKRFEELENRLGFTPATTNTANKLLSHRNFEGNSEKGEQVATTSYQRQHSVYPLRQHELSPKRFNSSMGSDTGNSTRESECSEENIVNSPVSRSPPIIAKPLPNPQQNSELFESLAAELRAKLNGNGPPLLLPPRDYDTVHRSKGNLAAIELRRCRNALIVGSGNSSAPLPMSIANHSIVNNGKIISSRGSSGIGSDLAPSPERQELNSSSDDEPWNNEADTSVIALKPSQISLERSRPIIPHPPLNGITSKHPLEESYLRDLPTKPYTSRTTHTRDDKITTERFKKNEIESSKSWVRGEDEIKPIIMRPADYDLKFNRILQSEQKPSQKYDSNHEPNDRYKQAEPRDSNRILKKNHSLEGENLSQHIKHKSHNSLTDFDETDRQSGSQHQHHIANTHKENIIEKQKFTEFKTSLNREKPTTNHAVDEARKYGGKQRYVDPADLPFQQNTNHTSRYTRSNHKNATHSPEPFNNRYNDHSEEQRTDLRNHFKEREIQNYSRSKERNPYREPESLPYIESMEKMIKSSAVRYKSQETSGPNNEVLPTAKQVSSHNKVYLKNKTSTPHEENTESYSHNEYNRYKEGKEKFRSIERAGSRHDLHEGKNNIDSKSNRRGLYETPNQGSKAYTNWSDEEPYYDTPPVEVCTRSRTREHWVEHAHKDRVTTTKRDIRARETSCRRSEPSEGYDNCDHRDRSKFREKFRENSQERGQLNNSREHIKRDYTPDRRSPSGNVLNRVDKRKDASLYTPQEISNRNSVPNMPKGYRHSYAEPVFARSAGRVGLAAVNPY